MDMFLRLEMWKFEMIVRGKSIFSMVILLKKEWRSDLLEEVMLMNKETTEKSKFQGKT